MNRSAKRVLECAWGAGIDEVLAKAEVDPEHGLDDDAVRRRRKRHGPNRLRETPVRSSWRIFFDQLQSVVVILLLVAAAAAAIFERVLEALAIGAAVLVNTLIGFGMELRATRAMEALQRMGKVSARVRRGGGSREIDADELVPGDIVLLDAGDMIAADLRLIEANHLQCDESALSGESLAVDKTTAAVQDSAALADRHNMAYKGTAVTQGSGAGVVISTGMETELGQISDLVQHAEQAVTPLEKRLDALGRRLVWLTLAIALVVAFAGFVAGKDLLLMIETAIAMAIAAVPEGLPVVATLALAQGMRRMARRNAVVKRLSAVETLGAANLIFTDKTGTLTENHMSLAELTLARGAVQFKPGNGGFKFDDRDLTPADAPDLLEALEVGVLCNNASLEQDGAVGDPTEIAFLEAAAEVDLLRPDLLQQFPEAREVSFDPDVKMMATLHQSNGEYLVAVKGAPEAVIDICSRIRTAEADTELDAEARDRWRERGEQLAAKGLRVLVLARKLVDEKQADPYSELTLHGLAGLYDPPRAGIKDAIGACREAGIRVVMGTGDHAATAGAIAAEIGLVDRDASTVDAAQLEDLQSLDESTRKDLLDSTVFSRISPAQKLDLISLYQDSGGVVAMTGDGVNDAPGLKKADIGIAMGKRGTAVAHEAADMVLKDDEFATIVVAIEHGRTIYRNIRRFIVYLLSGNLGEIMAIAFAALVAAPLPMLPLQILYINFVSDVMPALALGLSRSEAGVMQQAPRDAEEPIVSRLHWIAIFGYGALIAASVLGAFAIALLWLGIPTAEAVSLAFLTFGFSRLWHVFNMRSVDSPTFINDITTNPFVWIAILVGVLLLLAAVYLPGLSEILSTHPPDTNGWLLSLSFSLLPLLVVQLLKQGHCLWEQPGTHAKAEVAAD